MRRTFQQTIIFPSLCFLFFYLGNLLVGETQAKFSTHVSSEPIEISTAVVFPETIKQLENSAKEIEMNMKENYQNILLTNPEETLEELHIQLSQIKSMGQELYIQLDNLNYVYEELSSYKTQEGGQYKYVTEGYQTVENLRNEVLASIDFSKIEAIRSIFLLKINELEIKNKQVIENGEKMLEVS